MARSAMRRWRAGYVGHGGPGPTLLAEMDALKERLAEVEERLDFAERLLARAEAADQLPGRAQQ